MDTEKNLYQILLIDDHYIIRAGIKLILSEKLNVLVDEASNGNSALTQIKNNSYDLIMLDINLPDTDGFKLLAQILKVQPDSKVLVFSMNPEVLFAKRFIKMGARGYLNKEASDNEIVKATNTVLSGKKYISMELAEILLNETAHEKADNPFKSLSEREFEVAMSLIKGETPVDIANKMNLHPSTIGTYKVRILEKLNVHNVIELIQLAGIYDILTNK
ncbi:MAG: response regulator [Bacteroidetes bacterium]|nr:response regulator [Bacteroidota bacterium]